MDNEKERTILRQISDNKPLLRRMLNSPEITIKEEKLEEAFNLSVTERLKASSSFSSLIVISGEFNILRRSGLLSEICLSIVRSFSLSMIVKPVPGKRQLNSNYIQKRFGFFFANFFESGIVKK